MATLDALLADFDNGFDEFDETTAVAGPTTLSQLAALADAAPVESPRTKAASIEDLESDLYDFLDDYGDSDGDAEETDQFTHQPVDTSKLLSLQEPQPSEEPNLPSSSNDQEALNPVDQATPVVEAVEPAAIVALETQFSTPPPPSLEVEQQAEIDQVVQTEFAVEFNGSEFVAPEGTGVDMKKRFHELKAKFNAAAQQEQQLQQQQQTQKQETVAVAGDEKVVEEIVVESVSEVPEATTECSVAEDVKEVAPKETVLTVLESVEIAAVVSVEEPVESVVVAEVPVEVEQKEEVVETVAVSNNDIEQTSVIHEAAVVVAVESEQVLTPASPVSPAKSEDAVEESKQREVKPEPEVDNVESAMESDETTTAEEPTVVAEVIGVESVDVSVSAQLIESVETSGPETCAEAPVPEVLESVDTASPETSTEAIDTPIITPAIESVDVLHIETSVDSVDVSAPVVPSAPEVITEGAIPESAVVADVPREAIVAEESIPVITAVSLNELEAIVVEDDVDIDDFYGGDAVQEEVLIVESQASEQLVEARAEESAVAEKEKESEAPETDLYPVNGLLSQEANEQRIAPASTSPLLSTQPHQEYARKVVAEEEVVVVAEEEVVIADAPAAVITIPAYAQSRASSIYSPQNYDPDQEYPAISELNVHFRNSILDNDLEVQVIRMRGQVERTRILINEQLRLRNLPPLMPGQYTLQPTSPLSPVHRTQQQDGKRNSIISSISQRVVNVFSSVSGSTSPVPAAPTPSGSASTPTTPATPVPPAPTPQEEELRAMREELERTKKEIAEKMEKNKILLAQQQQQLQQQQGGFVPFVPAPPPSSSSPAPQRAAGSKPTDEFPGVHQVIEPKKAAKDADSTSVTSGKSGKSAKSTKSSGWSMFRSKSNKNLKEESSADGKPVARRKSIKESKPEAPPMMMMNQHMLGRF